MLLSGMETVPAAGPVNLESPLSVLRTVWSYFLLSRKAKELLHRHRFDVCHVEFTETGYFLAPTRGVPSVLTCHDIIAKP
ncbi:MAG: glycosyltransferase, partial [Deltaproteobacteria bacterium]|nr:glycosyltransferase [Deltaproteobacteria bacterium]